MKDYRKEFSVEKMCKVLRVSKSAFYGSFHYIPSNRDNENRALLFEIKRIHQENRASYGSPRMTKELNARGFKASEPRVSRLMRQAGIKSVHAKKYVLTTDSKHGHVTAQNILNQSFTASTPREAWVSDLTYIKTGTGWLYLTLIIDLYDRKVIGWSYSSDMTAGKTIGAAWKMAVRNRSISEQLTFHSDQGVQFACNEFTGLLKSYSQVKQSMSRRGNCWDNAVAESFFKSLKVECIYQKKYASRKEAELDIFCWIETWYNKKRRHAALGNLTIDEFNQLNQNKSAA
jgi:transposase InsO family protein